MPTLDELRKQYTSGTTPSDRELRGAARRKKLKKPDLPTGILSQFEEKGPLTQGLEGYAAALGSRPQEEIDELAGRRAAAIEPLARLGKGIGDFAANKLYPTKQYGTAVKGQGAPAIGIDQSPTLGQSIAGSFQAPLAGGMGRFIQDQIANAQLRSGQAGLPAGVAGTAGAPPIGPVGAPGTPGESWVEYQGQTIAGSPAEIKAGIDAINRGGGGGVGTAGTQPQTYPDALERFAQKQSEFQARNAPGGENAQRFRAFLDRPLAKTAEAKARVADKQRRSAERVARRAERQGERQAGRDTAERIAGAQAGGRQAVAEAKATATERKELPEATRRFDAWEKTPDAQQMTPEQRGQMKGALRYYTKIKPMLDPNSAEYNEEFAQDPKLQALLSDLSKVGLV